MAKCVVRLSGDSAVAGILHLSQASEGSPTKIEGEIRGLTPGKHGFSVNASGNLSEGAATTGDIFNPFGESVVDG